MFKSRSALAEKIHLRWAAHYSRVTGKPPVSGFSFSMYDSIRDVPEAALRFAAQSGDLFLSADYFRALEEAPPFNMTFKYAVVNRTGRDGAEGPAGFVYFQILKLDYRLHESPLKQLSKPQPSIMMKIHNRLIHTASVRLLVCGNVLISGEHGIYLPEMTSNEALHAVAEAAHLLRISERPAIAVTLIKDFYPRTPRPDTLERFGYQAFDAGPNLVIPIREQWTTFDVYHNDMKPKYRKRVAAALKKGAALSRRNLSADEIDGFRDEIYDCYGQVAFKSKFKTFFLNPGFYGALKRHLGDRFICEGYFTGGTLAGFTTRIVNGETLEGYSHGLRYELNKEYEIYQNFLLGDIAAAIGMNLKKILTGRTSAAMKSSLGAIPDNMICWMRFSDGHANQFIKSLSYFIRPRSEECRNPFGD